MIIKFLKHSDINQQKWDEAIRMSTAPKIYALSWYLNITSPNWKALVGSNYEPVFPLPNKKKLGLIPYMPVPYFTQQLGLFSKAEIDASMLHRFLKKIPKNYIKKDVLLNNSNPQIEQAIACTNYTLPLNQAIKDLKKNYSSQTKRNLKKAQKNGVTIDENILAKDIIHLFKKNKGVEINSLDYSVLEKLCKAAEKRGLLQTFGAFHEDSLHSGVIIFEYESRLYMIMLANNKESRNNGSSTLIIHHIIEKFADKDYILDFEGSNIPSLARFYKGFGSKNEAYQLYSTYF